jgi:DNA processing protein
MTMYGLSENEITPLLTALAARDVDRDEQEQLFARAAWTGIAEPGDRLAGVLVAALRASDSLRLLLAHANVDDVLVRLRAAGVDEVGEEEVGRGLERWAPRVKSATAVLALRQAARLGARLLVPGDALWPSGVDDLGVHAPLALWVRGTDAALGSLSRSIALVGARAATGYGEHVTMESAAGLVDRGYAIVSGAAYGIDGMAHRAALASRGPTIAFLAGGVDRFYPSGHDTLLGRIAEEGAVLSELPCGQPPTKWRFLQRNRLIAAASLATVVVEAGWRSGSLNTAAHASALGRPLGAVPGPVTSATSAGCHRLIRDFTAVCVTTPEEMAELAPLGPVDGGVRGELAEGGTGPTSEATRLVDAMSIRAPRDSADLAARAGLSLSTVRSLLGQLALDGRAVERERGWVKVTGSG